MKKTLLFVSLLGLLFSCSHSSPHSSTKQDLWTQSSLTRQVTFREGFGGQGGANR